MFPLFLLKTPCAPLLICVVSRVMSLRSSLKLAVATGAAVAVPFLFAASASASYTCTNVPVAPGVATPSGPAVACTEVSETVVGGSLTLSAPETATALTGVATSTTLGSKDQIAHYRSRRRLVTTLVRVMVGTRRFPRRRSRRVLTRLV